MDVTVMCDCDCDHDLLLVLDWTYYWVLDFLELALTYTLTLGELIVIITGKAEAFIYKSPSYNDARQCNVLDGKLSQLNDKTWE